jgi:hypothetical protein
MSEQLIPWFKDDLDGEEPQLGPLPPNLDYRQQQVEHELARLLPGLVELQEVARQGTLFDPETFKER